MKSETNLIPLLAKKTKQKPSTIKRGRNNSGDNLQSQANGQNHLDDTVLPTLHDLGTSNSQKTLKNDSAFSSDVTFTLHFSSKICSLRH